MLFVTFMRMCSSFIKSLFLHRFCGGLILDVKRKAPHYLSDYTDAVSLQCLASFLFLYCACMSPVITFGGLLGEATEGRVVRSFLFFSSSLYKHAPKASLYIQEEYTQSSAHRIKLKAFETSR